jgi:(S)-mandelate dehydrogenase
VSRRFHGGADIRRALSIAELRHMAERRLPGFVFEYLEGGAEEEVTLRRNRAVFDRLEFVPRTLVAGKTVDTATTFFGTPAALPLAIAPTGFCGLFARDGDLALARAAAAAGIPFIQSTVSNAPLEKVAATAGLSHWMQIYVFRSQSFMESLIARARAANCDALVVTSDATVFGNREWDRRNYRAGTDPTLMNKLETLCHPRWLLDVLSRGIPTFGNLLEALPPDRRDLAAAATWSRDEIDADLDWEKLARIRALWPGKLLLKGVLSADDAERAQAEGMDGIVVSNHGGRQLDGSVSPMNVLPEIVSRLGGKTTILIDSGFRRGTDIAKALCMGATAVCVGRPYIWGLGAFGQPGVERVLELLRTELFAIMQQVGAPSIKQLVPAMVRRV